MSRVIKFRVWDKVDYMSTPFTIQDIQKGDIGFTSDCPIMQFTGLQCYGKDVYEGDILRGDTRKYIVIYSDRDAKFKLQFIYTNDEMNSMRENISIGQTHKDMPLDGLFFEIIGNIYQNPELLEQKQKV